MKRHRTIGAAKAAASKTNSNPKSVPEETDTKELTPTAGEWLPEGSILELVRDSSDEAKLALLHGVGQNATIAHHIDQGNRRYVPISADPGLVRQLRLPVKDLPCGPTSELVNQISSILMQISELAADDAFKLAVFAMASFFADCLQAQLCLWLLGVANIEAMALLRVLAWFCWHPLLLLDDIGLDRLPENFTTTRLFYAAEPSAKLRKLISNFQAPGFGIFRAGLLREMRGATVIYSGATDLEGVCANGFLRIPVAPAIRLLSPTDEKSYHAAVEELRAKLLNYRLVHYRDVRSSTFDVTDFAGPTREIARGLGACLVDAPDLRDRLIALLQDQDESVRVEQSAEMSPVLESLMVFCHERRPSVHVSEIATMASDILSARGEWATLSPKEAGSRLKLLGLRTTRLDAGGRGLRLTREICTCIHRAARAFGAPAAEKGLAGCPDCQQALDQKNAHRACHAHDARIRRGKR